MATVRTTHLQHGASPVPNITLAPDGTVSFGDAVNFVTVTHGSVASTARPDARTVYWFGSVEPENAVAGDLWYAAASMPVVASGGTVTDIVDGGVSYRVHTFTTSGDFVVSRGGTVEYLIVAGGGGGGNGDDLSAAAGGGGAGGYIQDSTAVSAQTYSVVVGQGGLGSPNPGKQKGQNGQDSSAFGETAVGGGGGGGSNSTSGSNGGSGGGSTRSGTAGVGTAGQGNDGGVGGPFANDRTGGGGGGGGAAGENGGLNTGGDGGVGVDFSSLFGTSVGDSGWFAGGGASGAAGTALPVGGQGGGGDAVLETKAGSGLDGTGGGGAGGGEYPFAAAAGPDGGDGGDGIVIIRYPL